MIKAYLLWKASVMMQCVSSFYRYVESLQYISRNMHTVFALLCFVVVIHWLIFPYPSGLLHWHCGNLTIAPVPAKQPWWIWINTSCEFIMNDCITTTKQSTTKPCAYSLGYTVCILFQRCAAKFVVSPSCNRRCIFCRDMNGNSNVLRGLHSGCKMLSDVLIFRKHIP